MKILTIFPPWILIKWKIQTQILITSKSKRTEATTATRFFFFWKKKPNQRRIHLAKCTFLVIKMRAWKTDLKNISFGVRICTQLHFIIQRILESYTQTEKSRLNVFFSLSLLLQSDYFLHCFFSILFFSRFFPFFSLIHYMESCNKVAPLQSV